MVLTKGKRAHKKQDQAEFGEHRQKQLQELGTQLVSNLYMYIRSLKLYKANNKVFERPLQAMEKIINSLVAKERKVQLYGSMSTAYLNGTLLPFSVSALENVNVLLQALEERGMGGLLIEQPVTRTMLVDFLQQFGPDEKERNSGGHSAIRFEDLADVRDRLKELAHQEIQSEVTLKADSNRYAIILYCRLLHFVQRTLEPKQAPKPYIATRALQDLIDLAFKRRFEFLGFSTELDHDAYEGYHICNTTFCAILFGQHLGLQRLQLLELGQAALRHNLGKSRLPKALLDKHEDLTPEERNELRRIPLYTVQQIFKEPFNWKVLELALIASGINTPTPPTDDPDEISFEGPPLYSRIIGLCATFDALCTRRPFRPKLHPPEAIAFIRDHLDHLYDPLLINYFIKFFGSMLVRSTRRPIDWSEAPPEKRSWSAQEPTPLGQNLNRELLEYWSLRRLPRKTAEQEHRIDFLQKYLEWKSKKGRKTQA